MEKKWLNNVPSPAYVVEESALQHNLEILQGVQERTGAHILLAQKAFSMYHFYPLISKYLSGFAASGIYEARLVHEEAPNSENHVFNPAFQEKDFGEIINICDHIVFNSPAQWLKFRSEVLSAGKEAGIRLNPEHSTQDHAIYDPCSPVSRLGTKLKELEAAIEEYPDLLNGLTGFHFHTLCEQGAEPLAETLEAVEEKFGKYLTGMKWINFGGGHHITKDGYNIPLLEKCIERMQDKYGLEVYLEPGEAVALNAGYLVTTVLEIIESKNGSRECPAVILDTSAACHMPDVLEMPYRPPLMDSGEDGEKPYTYLLGGPTCLAGDVIGKFSFDAPLKVGDRLLFGDMAIYTMVKNNTFNGMPLPDIVAVHDDEIKVVKHFDYDDFKMRL